MTIVSHNPSKLCTKLVRVEEKFFTLTFVLRYVDVAVFLHFSRNEGEVGQAIKESGVKREDVFVVTKLQKAGHGYEECLEAFNSSLKK